MSRRKEKSESNIVVEEMFHKKGKYEGYPSRSGDTKAYYSIVSTAHLPSLEA